MAYPVLYGEYDLTIDDKNRLLIPADVRRCLKPDEDGVAFFLKIGTNGVPWLYPERYYMELGTRSAPEISPGSDALAQDQFHFALASRLEWDKQGRVLVPEKSLKRTGTGKDVVLIGARDHLELWNRDAWEKRKEELFVLQAERSTKVRQAQ